MKKIAMFVAAAAIAASASAQRTVVTASKATDNIYVGINAGVAAPTTHHSVFGNLSPELGVRVGKNFTTVFGLAVDATMHFSSMPSEFNTKTWVDNTNISLLGTANLSNLFAGYKGEPRTFEVIALGGFGWDHTYGIEEKANALTSKVALDFALNLGKNKAWQVYLEPSLTYGLNGWGDAVSDDNMKYDINCSGMALKLGVNYKFGTSNGTHNFAVEQLRDQAEIDALNAQINAARSEADAAKAAAAKKDAEIARLKKALSDCENKPAPVVETKAANLQPNVVFAQGKAVVEKHQMSNVEMIAKYMKKYPEAKIKISGYASPEGSKEFNQKLSEKRAAAVKDVLVKKYKIAADRLETEGLGATDKLFDEVEFNRVALFNDTTK
ncbi:MAG: OmpA family protein [Bacteroidales bacterium]|nr:OmpA family protein [Bacteroidales bacterium]MCM1146882.1 OmpA family protein [Bacteroidales bacterium]MCM1205620.1 OmpA family protein [Bacillota bacterium]MCM1510269.1 OmpA family protein [Clostridium sp.]